MYSFLNNWRHWLDSQGIWHTEDPQTEYDILFVNSFMVPCNLIAKVKQNCPRVRVVHRVDGAAHDYGRFDEADCVQARVNMLADLTIFQSEYSKYSATKKFKVIQQDGPIIYNPVDIQMFRPDGPKISIEGSIKVCNASFSTNPKKGTWKIGELAKQNPDITFVLCGQYPDLPDLPNIKLLGHLDRSKIAVAMRSCDLFLHMAENDPCPNVVLEALASGLPVLYVNSGGTPELVGDCGLPTTRENFREQLETIIMKRNDLSNAARERTIKFFSPDYIFTQYLNAIIRTIRRPLPSRLDFIVAMLRGYPVLPNKLSQLFLRTSRWSFSEFLRRVRQICIKLLK
jgi:glycosyltransferase involved in cell wall biosynthesis